MPLFPYTTLFRSGIEATIKTRTFLGKYVNYEILFADGMVLENQASIELSQDIGHTEKIYKVGEMVKLVPNVVKVNVFTQDGTRTLIKDVKQYA